METSGNALVLDSGSLRLNLMPVFAAMLAQRSDGSLFCSDRKLQLFVEPHECGIVASAEGSELIGGNGVKFLQDLISVCGKFCASRTFVWHTVSLNPIKQHNRLDKNVSLE